jgi:membrane-associated phospholipid phosphatase
MAGCTAVLLWTAPLIGVIMAIFAPLVGWARIRMKHHTPVQILIGWMVSMICVFVVFQLML